MKRFSGKIGQEYDLFRLVVPHHDELQQRIASIIAEHVKEIAHPVMVDVGCGSGFTTLAVAEIVKRGKIIGIDSERVTLEQANKRQYGIAVEFVCENEITALRKMPAESVDVVFSALGMEAIMSCNRPR